MNKNNKILERNMKTYKAFDLQAAIDGDPIMTIQGIVMRFGGYFPFAGADYRVVVFNQHGNPSWYREDGSHSGLPGGAYDLVMAPKKNKVWVRLWRDNATGKKWTDFNGFPTVRRLDHDVELLGESVHEIEEK